MHSSIRTKIIGVFLLALILRAGLFVALNYHSGTWQVALTGDSSAYHQLGENLLNGRGFSESITAPFTPVAGRMPIVPLMIALVGGSSLVFLILQILVASVSAVFVYRLGARVFEEEVGFWAGILLAADPLSVYHSGLVLTESFFTFFILGSLLLLAQFQATQKIGFAATGGVMIGIASLIRPVGPVIALLLALSIFFFWSLSWRNRFVGFCAFVLCLLAVVAPWGIRNHQVFGVWSLSSLPSYNLYFYNARVFYAQEHHLTNEQAKNVFRQWASEAPAEIVSNELRMSEWYRTRALGVIQPQLPLYIRFHLINSAAVFLNTGWSEIASRFEFQGNDINLTSVVYGGWSQMRAFVLTHPLLIVGKLILILLYGLLVVGLFLKSGLPQSSGYYFLFLLLALSLAITTGAVAEPRFRVPAEPFLFLLVAEAFRRILSIGSIVRTRGADGGTT